jgi:hypothetical protein
LDSYTITKNTNTGIQLEKGIHFVHNSYIEFFLAEHLIEHYIKGNFHLLNIGKPSQVTIDFLRGFLELITLQDEEIQKKYVVFDRSKPATLFHSLGYDDTVKKAIEKILSTAYESFDNENIITLNIENRFFINLDNSDSGSLLESIEKLFWKENLNSEINTIENLWISRLVSLFIIELLESKDKIKQNVNKYKVARLIRSTSHSVPYYLKLFSFLNLSITDLRGANLEGANLEGANLGRANLREADLGGADLEGADLRGADLRGDNLEGDNLEGADLRGAINLPFSEDEAKRRGAVV